jgi:hypothetical protein
MPEFAVVHASQVNYVALIVAAVTRFVIGGVWYSPALFGPAWHRLLGLSPDITRPLAARACAIDFVAGFISAAALVVFARALGAQTAMAGALLGLAVWLGLVATTTFAQANYEQRPLRLFGINAGFQLVGFVAMGAILGAWN